MNRNLSQPINGEIVDIIDESSTIKSFVVVPEEEFSFQTGQFVELTMPGVGEAPFTPSSSPADNKKMEITIMKAGRVTDLLHQCKKGEKEGIRGPFRHGYPVDDFVGKQIYIVGGGVGLAPIRSLFLTLVDRIKDFKSVVCRFGARTPEDFIYKKTLFGPWQKINGVDMKLTVAKAEGDWKGGGEVRPLYDRQILCLQRWSGFDLRAGRKILRHFRLRPKQGFVWRQS